jgi:hypothetical protein
MSGAVPLRTNPTTERLSHYGRRKVCDLGADLVAFEVAEVRTFDSALLVGFLLLFRQLREIFDQRIYWRRPWRPWR